MPSRENYILSSVVLAGFTVLVVAELQGVLNGWTTLASFLLVAVIGFALPQFYFAVTRDDHLTQLRLRLIPIVLLIFGSGISGVASTAELFGIWSVVGCSILLLFAYEFRSGYLTTVGTER